MEAGMKRLFAFSFPRCADVFVEAFLPMDSAAQRPLCKKISELWWRSGDGLDSNLRSTGPLKIVVFFPHSDKAKSNFGKDDHLHDNPLWWVIWYEPVRLWCRKASSSALSRPDLSLISNILRSLSFVCHLSLSHWSHNVRHSPGRQGWGFVWGWGVAEYHDQLSVLRMVRRSNLTSHRQVTLGKLNFFIHDIDYMVSIFSCRYSYGRTRKLRPNSSLFETWR